jgi:hypothetical protein
MRLQSNNEPVDAGLISVPFWRQNRIPSPIPWVLPSSALAKVLRAKLSTPIVQPSSTACGARKLPWTP